MSGAKYKVSFNFTNSQVCITLSTFTNLSFTNLSFTNVLLDGFRFPLVFRDWNVQEKGALTLIYACFHKALSLLTYFFTTQNFFVLSVIIYSFSTTHLHNYDMALKDGERIILIHDSK